MCSVVVVAQNSAEEPPLAQSNGGGTSTGRGPRVGSSNTRRMDTLTIAQPTFAAAIVVHTKIGNGYGGFEHPSNETACRLPSRGRRIDMNAQNVTCIECVAVCLTMFGQP